jgi:hypothetical protein
MGFGGWLGGGDNYGVGEILVREQRGNTFDLFPARISHFELLGKCVPAATTRRAIAASGCCGV